MVDRSNVPRLAAMMPTLIPKFNLAERLPSFMSVEVDGRPVSERE